LIAAAAFMVFFHLSFPDIRLWDEGTNADVVASSLEARSFPALSTHEGPFFEKPPLWYYTVEGLVALRGYDPVSLRLPAAVAGFVLILLVGAATARFHSWPASAIAVLFLLACGQLFVFKPNGIFATHHARSADGDLVQIVFMFGAFLAFGAAAEGRRAGLYTGAVLTGLAVLTKGPLGFLPAIVFALHRAIASPRAPLPARDLVGAGLALGAVVAPWHAYMVARFGRKFVDEYALYALVHRVADTLEGHGSAWNSYFLLLKDRAVCCSAEILAAACVVPFLDRPRLREYRVAAPLLSVLIVMATISLMQTKLAWYVLPVYPYAAVLVGGLFDACRMWAAGTTLWPVRALAAASALAIAGVVTAYAGRDVRDIALVKRGWMQTFFEGADARCHGSLAYADERLPGDLLYLLRKHRVALGPPGEATCFIGWREDDPPNGVQGVYRRVEVKGHLSLWMR
jgi:4-amino-4-deoxy-L-arabinose transferase-like glycosyltransferase